MPVPLSLMQDDRSLAEIRGDGRTAARRVTGVRLLVAGAIGLLLYVAHAAFVPLALAALVALVLSGPVETLRGFGVPRSLSAMLLVLAMLAIVAAVSDLLYEPAQHWFAEAPHTLRVIERKIRPVEQFMNRLDNLRDSAGNIG